MDECTKLAAEYQNQPNKRSYILIQLHKKYKGLVYSLLNSLYGIGYMSQQDKEDFIQESYFTLITSLADYDKAKGSFHVWHSSRLKCIKSKALRYMLQCDKNLPIGLVDNISDEKMYYNNINKVIKLLSDDDKKVLLAYIKANGDWKTMEELACKYIGRRYSGWGIKSKTYRIIRKLRNIYNVNTKQSLNPNKND